MWLDPPMLERRPSLMVRPGALATGEGNLYDVYAGSVAKIEKQFSTVINEQNIRSYTEPPNAPAS